MDGIQPRLIFWDLKIEVLHSDSNRKQKFMSERRNPSSIKASEKKQSDTKNFLELWHVDFVSSNAKYPHEGTKLYIFVDNEAVIKMIMKGRSPNFRNVFRTDRVAHDSLFDRIILDPKIRIRYADILTKVHFTRDEWNHLPCLFDISLVSSESWIESISQNRSEGMAKRQQEGDYDERVVAKSKPVRNLVSRSCAVPWTTPS